ncbi:hypothetical protein H696_02559 [Fonticula alba]|uniref:Uncharacterized protein n=1 Tax=Fonticula alba TaxID=691883 RepID=A0A058Z7F2_FONAL|nr:hypothetical protein H696_02559 [Fonticula alba]KCV70229.1 hypothetical protein H696_02559 [Fonticula alba]|eukprot:XP_009494745.1 hypothetical protein H696_02559 [Fonticula alba]
MSPGDLLRPLGATPPVADAQVIYRWHSFEGLRPAIAFLSALVSQEGHPPSGVPRAASPTHGIEVFLAGDESAFSLADWLLFVSMFDSLPRVGALSMVATAPSLPFQDPQLAQGFAALFSSSHLTLLSVSGLPLHISTLDYTDISPYHCEILRSLSLTHAPLPPVGVYLLSLCNLPSLRRLSLSDTGLSAQHDDYLISWLEKLLPCLEHLDLSENQLGDSFIQRLAGIKLAGGAAAPLRALLLQDNQVSFAGVSSLLAAIAGKALLRGLLVAVEAAGRALSPLVRPLAGLPEEPLLASVAELDISGHDVSPLELVICLMVVNSVAPMKILSISASLENSALPRELSPCVICHHTPDPGKVFGEAGESSGFERLSSLTVHGDGISALFSLSCRHSYFHASPRCPLKTSHILGRNLVDLRLDNAEIDDFQLAGALGPTMLPGWLSRAAVVTASNLNWAGVAANEAWYYFASQSDSLVRGLRPLMEDLGAEDPLSGLYTADSQGESILRDADICLAVALMLAASAENPSFPAAVAGGRSPGTTAGRVAPSGPLLSEGASATENIFFGSFHLPPSDMVGPAAFWSSWRTISHVASGRPFHQVAPRFARFILDCLPRDSPFAGLMSAGQAARPLSQLQYLSLSGNFLTHFPPWLSGMRELQCLDLSHNLFHGRGLSSISSFLQLSLFPKIRQLFLHENPFDHYSIIPALLTFVATPSLESVTLHGDNPIPASYISMATLLIEKFLSQQGPQSRPLPDISLTALGSGINQCSLSSLMPWSRCVFPHTALLRLGPGHWSAPTVGPVSAAEQLAEVTPQQLFPLGLSGDLLRSTGITPLIDELNSYYPLLPNAPFVPEKILAMDPLLEPDNLPLIPSSDSLCVAICIGNGRYETCLPGSPSALNLAAPPYFARYLATIFAHMGDMGNGTIEGMVPSLYWRRYEREVESEPILSVAVPRDLDPRDRWRVLLYENLEEENFPQLQADVLGLVEASADGSHPQGGADIFVVLYFAGVATGVTGDCRLLFGNRQGTEPRAPDEQPGRSASSPRTAGSFAPEDIFQLLPPTRVKLAVSFYDLFAPHSARQPGPGLLPGRAVPLPEGESVSQVVVAAAQAASNSLGPSSETVSVVSCTRVLSLFDELPAILPGSRRRSLDLGLGASADGDDASDLEDPGTGLLAISRGIGRGPAALRQSPSMGDISSLAGNRQPIRRRSRSMELRDIGAWPLPGHCLEGTCSTPTAGAMVPRSGFPPASPGFEHPEHQCVVCTCPGPVGAVPGVHAHSQEGLKNRCSWAVENACSLALGRSHSSPLPSAGKAMRPNGSGESTDASIELVRPNVASDPARPGDGSPPEPMVPFCGVHHCPAACGCICPAPDWLVDRQPHGHHHHNHQSQPQPQPQHYHHHPYDRSSEGANSDSGDPHWKTHSFSPSQPLGRGPAEGMGHRTPSVPPSEGDSLVSSPSKNPSLINWFKPAIIRRGETLLEVLVAEFFVPRRPLNSALRACVARLGSMRSNFHNDQEDDPVDMLEDELEPGAGRPRRVPLRGTGAMPSTGQGPAPGPDPSGIPSPGRSPSSLPNVKEAPSASVIRDPLAFYVLDTTTREVILFP